MDFVEFQEKMDPAHRENFCRMLKMKQLPESLLKFYLGVKKLTDRIDGHLYVGDLAIIALLAGYNPDTGKFGLTLAETTEGKDAQMQEQADDLAVEPPLEQAGNEPLDEEDDEVIEEALEQPDAPQPVDPQPEQPVEQTEVQAEHAAEQAAEKPTPEEKAKLWSLGMPVNVLREDKLEKGKIFGVHPAQTDEEQTQLTVSLDNGQTVTVNEVEVEAV